jgi:hypothetical protein
MKCCRGTQRGRSSCRGGRCWSGSPSRFTRRRGRGFFVVSPGARGNARAENAATARITRFSTAVHTSPQINVKPRNVKVSGFPSPCRSLLLAAKRPNSISGVLCRGRLKSSDESPYLDRSDADASEVRHRKPFTPKYSAPAQCSRQSVRTTSREQDRTDFGKRFRFLPSGSTERAAEGA